MGKNFEDSEGDLLGKTDNNVVANGIAETPIRHISQKKLLASKFLSALRED